MVTKLTNEQVDWLNQPFSKEDCEEIGMDWKPDYEGIVRWQMANIASYATEQSILYSPQKDPRLTLANYKEEI